MAGEPRNEDAQQTSGTVVTVGEGRTLLERAGEAAAGIGSVGEDRPRLRNAIQLGAGILILVFLVAVVVSQAGKLPDYDWRFAPGWLVLAFASVGFAYVWGGELWRWILLSLGDELDRPRARSIYAKSLLARYVPTSMLMVVGRVVMAERFGVRKRSCLASIVYEMALSIAAAVILGAYFFITLPRFEGAPARFAVLLIVPIALAALHPRVFAPLSTWGLRKLGREPLTEVLPFSRVVLIAGGYLIHWTAWGLGVYAFASALRPLDAGDVPFIVASYSVAFCAAAATFIIPGGLGTREAALAAALQTVMPFRAALAVSVAFRLFQFVVEAVYLSASILLGRRGGPPPLTQPSEAVAG